MRKLDLPIIGPTIIRDDTRALHGGQGDVSVDCGASLELHGVLRGNLLIRPGSVVDVRGQVQGRILNEGGELRRA